MEAFFITNSRSRWPLYFEQLFFYILRLNSVQFVFYLLFHTLFSFHTSLRPIKSSLHTKTFSNSARHYIFYILRLTSTYKGHY